MYERIRILDVPVDMVNYEQALADFRRMMRADRFAYIVTPNPEIILASGADGELKKIMDEADLAVPDGVGIVYASRMLGKSLSERVTGIDLLEKILGELEKTGQTVFFLGGKPGVAEKAAAAMREKYRGLAVAGVRDGYFEKDDEDAVIAEINESGAAFLCVGLGFPKQEKFIYTHKDVLKVKAAVGVGGSFDVLSGELKRAPAFYQNHGLEWLYRLRQQPSRYKRMTRLPIFMLKVWLRKKRSDRRKSMI